MLNRLGRIWRFGGTGLAIASFSLGGGLLAILVFPLLKLFGANPTQSHRRVQNVISGAFRFYLWVISRMGIIEIDTQNGDQLAACSGCVIVANHPTLLDIVLLLSIVPNGSCIVKHQLWESFFLRGVVSRAGYIRNDMAAEALLESCSNVFASGANLVVFPEGTRTEPGEQPIFHRGFANIALLAGVSVQPVTIRCEPPILTRSRPWYYVPAQRPRFSVSVHAPLPIESFMNKPHRSQNARQLVRMIQTIISGQYPK